MSRLKVAGIAYASRSVAEGGVGEGAPKSLAATVEPLTDRSGKGPFKGHADLGSTLENKGGRR